MTIALVVQPMNKSVAVQRLFFIIACVVLRNYPGLNERLFRPTGGLIGPPHIQDLPVLQFLFIRMSRFVEAQWLAYQIRGRVVNVPVFTIRPCRWDHYGIEVAVYAFPHIFPLFMLTALKHIIVLSHAAFPYSLYVQFYSVTLRAKYAPKLHLLDQ